MPLIAPGAALEEGGGVLVRNPNWMPPLSCGIAWHQPPQLTRKGPKDRQMHTPYTAVGTLLLLLRVLCVEDFALIKKL
jgi:hypothetical protein